MKASRSCRYTSSFAAEKMKSVSQQWWSSFCLPGPEFIEVSLLGARLRIYDLEFTSDGDEAARADVLSIRLTADAKFWLPREIPTLTLGTLNASFRKWGSVLLLCFCAALARGGNFGSSPDKFSVSASRVQSTLQAMERAPLGFTPAIDRIHPELDQSPAPLDDDFSPMLLFMALIFLLVIVVGGIATILVSICLVVLLTAGTISTALIVGFLRRSVSDGFRTFFILVGAILGLGSGVIAVCIVDTLKKVSWTSPLPWVIGAAAGAGLGILCAWLFNLAWSYAAKRLGERIG